MFKRLDKSHQSVLRNVFSGGELLLALEAVCDLAEGEFKGVMNESPKKDIVLGLTRLFEKQCQAEAIRIFKKQLGDLALEAKKDQNAE